MSLDSSTSRNDYVGNNTTPTYSYTFRIFDEDHLLITEKDTNDVETTLVITTDYTVTGVGEENGGTITLVAGNLATGHELTIRRKLPLTQDTDIRNQGNFLPETHEDQFDRGIMIDQQQQDELDRCMQLPETIPASTFDPSLPTDVASADKIFGVNSAGNAVRMLTPAQVIALSGSLAPGNNLNDVSSKDESRNNLFERLSVTIANNQAGAADLTGVTLDQTVYKSGVYLAHWFRDATTDLVAWEIFSMDRNPGSGSWGITRGIAWGDLDGVASKPAGILTLTPNVVSDIVTAQYTSSNETGGASATSYIFQIFKIPV